MTTKKQRDAPRRAYETSEGDLDWAALARKLPEVYSLCKLPRATVLYRGTSSEADARVDCPSDYARFTPDLVQAAECALGSSGRGPHPLLRTFALRRDLVLLNLDSMSYCDLYCESELRQWSDANDAADEDELRELTEQICTRIGRRKCAGETKPTNALRWLLDADDCGDRVTERDLCRMLREHWPQLDGFVRNTTPLGARELVLARADRTLRCIERCACTAEDQAHFDAAGISSGYNLFSVNAVVTRTSRVPRKHAAARRWLTGALARRYKLLTELDNDNLTDLCDTLLSQRRALAISIAPASHKAYEQCKNALRALRGWRSVPPKKRKRPAPDDADLSATESFPPSSAAK
jgi:hypothetical protein